MNQTVDHILLIALDENISYEEKRNRIAKLIKDNRPNDREAENRDVKETDNNFYERPEYGDYERD